jgi:Protein of unknown function (DUF2924)
MLQRIESAAVEAEIERVRSLSGHALRRRWQTAFGRSIPKPLTADLLRRMIADRIQEEAFGTLDRATLKNERRLRRRRHERRGARRQGERARQSENESASFAIARCGWCCTAAVPVTSATASATTARSPAAPPVTSAYQKAISSVCRAVLARSPPSTGRAPWQ